MEFSTLLYEVGDGVATITLNRPDVRNAFNDEMSKELRDALKSAERDAAVRCLLITGSGKGFCAGQDLAAFRSRSDDSSIRAHLQHTFNPMMSKIASLEKPVIAAVNGVAAGAGLGLALSCDFRYAAEGARFLMAFIGIGLAPDSGTAYFLPRLLGLGRALEMAYTNEIIDAPTALSLGLVNKVVPDDQLISESLEVAKRLAQAPTKGIGLTKRAMRYALNATLDETLDYEAYLQEIAGRTSDHREGVAAFVDKRKPNFSGS